jgi:cytochrome c oxidase subunit 2
MIEYYVYKASSFAGDIDDLFVVITWIIGVCFLLTLGAFIYFMIRFRRKEGVKAEYITIPITR